MDGTSPAEKLELCAKLFRLCAVVTDDNGQGDAERREYITFVGEAVEALATGVRLNRPADEILSGGDISGNARIGMWRTTAESALSAVVGAASAAAEGQISEQLGADIGEAVIASRLPEGSKSVLLLGLSLSARASAPVFSYTYMRLAFSIDDALQTKIGLKRPEYVFDGGEEALLERCPVCGGADSVPVYNAFSYMMNHFGAPFSPAKLWVQCRDCGNMHTYGFPGRHLRSGPGGGELIAPREGAYAPASKQPVSLPVWGKILSSLAEYTSGRELLEVGIGAGELIATALEFGFDVSAVEISEEQARYAADMLGIPIWRGDMLDFDTERRFDIITMGDVIEHVSDPRAALVKAHGFLRDGGVLWLSTPNFESGFTRMMKFGDAMWCEPSHISWFSFDTLRALLSETGFEVREYSVSGRYNGSMELTAQKR
ncbi:MAG: methyltransferase domain-containing protein [Oscillospiraceae bacterium]|nr:methyltransferase domain-containing protein [Oscillospiraceae bacterium]